MSVLVTGGTGFIGAALARLLLESGNGPVTLFDLFLNENTVREFGDEVRTVRGDFSEATEISRVLHDHEVTDVFHLGYLTGEAEMFPARAIRTNCEGSNAMFECAMDAGVRRVLWPSSAAVYGATVTTATPSWLTEDDPVAPDSMYGACKLFNEHNAERHHQRRGLDYAALRLCSIAGPGRGERRGIPADLYATIVDASMRGEPVVAPPASHVLSWGYVNDVARAFHRLFTAESLTRRVYNFSGQRVTVGEVADLVRDACPQAQIQHGSEAPRHLAYVDATRLSSDLDFELAYSAQNAIADHLQRLA